MLANTEKPKGRQSLYLHSMVTNKYIQGLAKKCMHMSDESKYRSYVLKGKKKQFKIFHIIKYTWIKIETKYAHFKTFVTICHVK